MAMPRPTAATNAIPAALWRRPVTVAAGLGVLVDGFADGASSEGVPVGVVTVSLSVGLRHDILVRFESFGARRKGSFCSITNLEPVEDEIGLGRGTGVGRTGVGAEVTPGPELVMEGTGVVSGKGVSVIMVIWIMDVSSETRGGSTGRLYLPVPSILPVYQ